MNTVLPFRFLMPFAGVLLAACAATSVHADWRSFHGAQNQGLDEGSVLPNSWTDDDYAWQFETDTADVGSAVIADGQVYFLASSTSDSELRLQCLSAKTGLSRWSHSQPQNAQSIHARNTMASSTPTVDANGVVYAYADPDHTFVVAVDNAGQEIWRNDFGPWQSQHGFGTSPAIIDNMVVILVSMDAEELPPGVEAGQSHLIAMDRGDGEIRWKRPLRATRTCYGIPTVHRSEYQTSIVIANTGNGIAAIDPANGEFRWQLPLFSKRSCSSPVVAGDIVLATQGGGAKGELFAVRMPTKADQPPKELYSIDRSAPYVPTTAIRGDHAYWVDDKGLASCVVIESGEVIWNKRIGGNYGASPVILGDRMLVISLDGKASILAADPNYELISQFDLGGPVGATPAVADGLLVIRVGNQIRGLRVQ